MILFRGLRVMAAFAKQRAQRGLYDGQVNDRNMRLMHYCSHLCRVDLRSSARVIYTRDVGHHENGWWKNPDYERCLHLSISFIVNPTNEPLPFDKRWAQKIAEAFFGDDVRKAWVEPPYTDEGKAAGVHHYRIFCDPSWAPIVPRGEVYDKRDTPAHWRSFSEIHGYAPAPEQAPWLKAASE